MKTILSREQKIDFIQQRMKELGLNQRSVALSAGLHEDALRNFFRGKSKNLRSDIYEKLMDVLQPNEEVVLHSHKGEEETTRIPVYDIRASAGGGVVIQEENILYHTTFSLDFLRRVSSSPLEMLSVITVDGDSMQPTLSPEDTVLIDRSQITPKKDGIYVLRYDNSLLVKRLSYDPQRRIVTIISDNDRYPPRDISDLDCLQIIGRVLWLGRRV